MTRDRAITQVAKLSEGTVRAMLIDLLSVDGDDVVADDLLAALQANPNRAIRVLGQLRIAGPWSVGTGIVQRFDAVTADCVSFIERSGNGRWYTVTDTDDQRPIGNGFATLPEAQAAEDARLTSEGWAFASDNGSGS